MSASALAPAKVNLVLHVGARRSDGLHGLCSLFASLELADRVEVEVRDGEPERDRVECPGVEGPNLASSALAAYRATAPGSPLPALSVRIEKRIPVAAGLGGGSADAAAVLRMVDALAPRPRGPEVLRDLGATLGADVPSQVEPGHALVTGAGEGVERISLPSMILVLVAQATGLSTARVYAEADRLGLARARLDPQRLRELSRATTLEAIAPAFENDLEPAALSLRPELADLKRRLREAGAAAALVSGSGPTVVGAFADPTVAARAAARIDGAIVTGLRGASSVGAEAGDASAARAPDAGRRRADAQH